MVMVTWQDEEICDALCNRGVVSCEGSFINHTKILCLVATKVNEKERNCLQERILEVALYSLLQESVYLVGRLSYGD